MLSKSKYLFFVLIRFAMGAIFVWAGISKMSDLISFADNIAAFEILPAPLISPLALTLPVFEILIGILFIFGPGVRMAAVAIMVMSFVFLVALTTALIRGLDVNCGCFGGGEAKGTMAIVKSIGRDLLLILGAALVWYFNFGSSQAATLPGDLDSAQVS